MISANEAAMLVIEARTIGCPSVWTLIRDRAKAGDDLLRVDSLIADDAVLKQMRDKGYHVKQLGDVVEVRW